LTVVDRRVPREECTVIILLEAGIDIGLACRELLKPVVFVFLTDVEPLHIARRFEFAVCFEVRRGGGIEHEIRDTVPLNHRVQVENVVVCRMEAYQRGKRTLVQLVVVIRRVEQLPMQIPINDAGGKLGNFADMRSERVPAILATRSVNGASTAKLPNRERESPRPINAADYGQED
jgi:hypothetical protein